MMNNVFRVEVYCKNDKLHKARETYFVSAKDDIEARKNAVEWYSKTGDKHEILYCAITHMHELIGDFNE